MKIITKKTFIRAPTNVWAFMVLFVLLSSMIGTTAWAKPEKQESPGKSVKTWDVKIWIGEAEEDIVLTSPVHDDGVYLVAEDVSCSGNLWDIPKKKGRGPNPNNHLFAQVDFSGWEEEDWCTWELADVEGYNGEGQPVSLGVFELESLDTVYVSIQHAIMSSGADYWTFVIQCKVEYIPNITYEFYEFRAWTNRDENAEGELINEEWLVPFNEAEAILYSDWTDETPPDWTGTVSFTVRITRSPHVTS